MIPRKPVRYLNAGELIITDEDVLISTVLGSCVAVIVHDPKLKATGMNHYLLPESSAIEPLRFGESSIRALFRGFKELGSERSDLIIQLVGGSLVTSNSQIAVGAQNIQVARRLLSTLGLPIAKEDVGSLQGRRVVVEAHSGTAWIKRLERTHTEDLPVTRDTHILALGASTGGTQALQDILMALPSGLPPIVVVQHMPEDFTGGFAEALSRVCAFPVNEPKQGELLQPGRAYLAPGNLHMRVKSGERGLWFDLRNDPLVNGFRPSVDVLFDSLKSVPRKVIAGLLTGMGHDGARGLLELRKIGARTVAQDESTSVVYGMPKAAADLGAAEKILPLPEIAPFFLRCLSKPNSKAA